MLKTFFLALFETEPNEYYLQAADDHPSAGS